MAKSAESVEPNTVKYPFIPQDQGTREMEYFLADLRPKGKGIPIKTPIEKMRKKEIKSLRVKLRCKAELNILVEKKIKNKERTNIMQVMYLMPFGDKVFETPLPIPAENNKVAMTTVIE